MTWVHKKIIDYRLWIPNEDDADRRHSVLAHECAELSVDIAQHKTKYGGGIMRSRGLSGSSYNLVLLLNSNMGKAVQLQVSSSQRCDKLMKPYFRTKILATSPCEK
jgi:hypothetical protein